MTRRSLTAAALLGAALLIAGCGATAEPTRTGVAGDPDRGREVYLQYGCASCHATPDVPSVSDGIGPDLHDFASNVYIAGQIPNRPEELIQWIRQPQQMIPGSIMPNMGVTQEDAEDIAAFLYSR